MTTSSTYITRHASMGKFCLLILTVACMALDRKKAFTCTVDDYKLLATKDNNLSPIRMFRCLVIVDQNMPPYCTHWFYTNLSSDCTACTFGTLKATYLSCFMQCSEDASSDYCMECSSSYIAQWKDKCIGKATYFLIDMCPVGPRSEWGLEVENRNNWEVCRTK